MPVPLLSPELLLQHPDLLSFLKERDPSRLSYMLPTIKKRYEFVRGQDGGLICMSPLNLAIVYGRYEALKYLKLEDSYLGNVFHTVIWSLESNHHTEVIPECSLNIIKYLVSIEAVKISFKNELLRLLALSPPHKTPDSYMNIVLKNMSKSYDLFIEIIFKSNIYYNLGWIYFIKILKNSPEKTKIINFLLASKAIDLSLDNFGQLICLNDGSSEEVLVNYTQPKKVLVLDYTKTPYSGRLPTEFQVGLINLLIKSPSLVLLEPVVLEFFSDQISDIYDDLVKNNLRISDRIRVIIDGFDLVDCPLFTKVLDDLEIRQEEITHPAFFTKPVVAKPSTEVFSSEVELDDGKKCLVM